MSFEINYATLLIALLSAFIGGLIAHKFAVGRDSAAEKRKRISDFVNRFYEAIKKYHSNEQGVRAFELLVPCGVLLLRTNKELDEAREQIVKMGLPDPARSYPDLNVYDYLKFCYEENYDTSTFGAAVMSRVAYKESRRLRWRIAWFFGRKFELDKSIPPE